MAARGHDEPLVEARKGGKLRERKGVLVRGNFGRTKTPSRERKTRVRCRRSKKSSPRGGWAAN